MRQMPRWRDRGFVAPALVVALLSAVVAVAILASLRGGGGSTIQHLQLRAPSTATANNGNGTPDVRMPNLVGEPNHTAEATLSRVGQAAGAPASFVKEDSVVAGGSVPPGTVMAQVPAAGAPVTATTEITLKVAE